MKFVFHRPSTAAGNENHVNSKVSITDSVVKEARNLCTIQLSFHKMDLPPTGI